MPLFVYRCEVCDNEEEKLVKSSERDDVQTCECGSDMVKQISLSSFQLKGGGWYKDLYASKKPND